MATVMQTAAATTTTRHRVVRGAVAVAGMLMAATVAWIPSSAGLEARACTTWDVRADYAATPQQENPNPDSCGNDGVWYFMERPVVDGVTQPYRLLTLYDAVDPSDGTVGLEAWHGDRYAGTEPRAGKNVTGRSFWHLGFWVPKDSFYVHPMALDAAVVAWRSPVTGTVTVKVRVGDLDPLGGNGVETLVLRNGSHLGAIRVKNGAEPRHITRTISVAKGDFLYVVTIPVGTDFYYDTTALDVHITMR